MKKVEIIITYEKNHKYMVEFKDINNKPVGISLMRAGYIRIDNMTNEVTLPDVMLGKLSSFIAKDRIYVYIDPILIGNMYDVTVTRLEDAVYIHCRMKPIKS